MNRCRNEAMFAMNVIFALVSIGLLALNMVQLEAAFPAFSEGLLILQDSP
jgi:hypothetical protein